MSTSPTGGPAGTPEAPRVAALWRFPVKSMQGEPMASAVLTAAGLEGDRIWALRDTETGRVLTGKRTGVLLFASARTQPDGTVLITLPEGEQLVAGEPGTDDALSAWLDQPCRLDRAASGTEAAFEMSFDAEHPDTDLFTWPCPPGTFLDLASAHLLTTSSVAAARAAGPDADWDLRRFRPTVLLDTGTDGAFFEDAWVGGSVQIGDAVLRVDMATVRCPIPSRTQPGLERDLRVSATLRDYHDNNLGVYATVTTPGTVTVGDLLTVI